MPNLNDDRRSFYGASTTESQFLANMAAQGLTALDLANAVGAGTPIFSAANLWVDMSGVGGPTFGAQSAVGVALDDATTEGAGFMVGVPTAWTTFSVGIIVAGAAAGDVRVGGGLLGGATFTEQTAAVTTGISEIILETAASGAAYASDMQGAVLYVQRVGAHAADTSVGDLSVYGATVRQTS